MLRYLKLILLVLLAITLASCDLREPRGLPTIFDMITQPTEDFYLVTEAYYDQSREEPLFWVQIMSKEPVESLVLGGQLMIVDAFTYSGFNGYYYYDLNSPTNIWNLLEGHDEDLDYEIYFADQSVSGSLEFPSEYSLIDPEFDYNQNLDIEWLLLKNPRKQLLDINLRDSDSNNLSYYEEPSPSTRSLVIPNTYWSELTDLTRSEIEISAYNYQFHEEGLVCFISTLDYNSGSLSSLKNPSRHLQRILKDLHKYQN